MNETLLLWGFGMFAAAFLLLVIEMFVPSAGIIGALSGVLAIVGVVCFWRVSTTWGLSSLLALMVLAPLTIGFALKVWPDTPIGRRMILGARSEEERARERADEAARAEERREALIGAEGVAVTDLRPVGTVKIEGERVEALAQGGMIAKGDRVRVYDVQGNQIKVRGV